MPLKQILTEFRSSFSYRLFFVFTILTALLSILLGSLYVTTEIREKRKNTADQLQLLAQQFAQSVRLPLYAENRETLLHLAEQATSTSLVHSVSIMAADGKLLAEAHRKSAESRTETIAATEDVFSDPLVSSVEEALTGAPPAAPVRIGSVRMERDITGLSHEIARLTLSALFFALLFWLAVSYVCYLVLQRVIGSFDALLNGIQAMQGGDYSSRVEVVSHDEPGKAAMAVNRLADSLQQRKEENLKLQQELLAANQSLEEEIGERIQAELTVCESEQNLKTLLDGMPIGVAWTDNAGNLEYLNNYFAEHFGYNREEIRTVNDWFSRAYPDEEYRSQIMELRQAALEAGQKDSTYTPMYESRVRCGDGRIRQVINKLTTTRKRTVILLIDITDREILQEQLIKTQKLESIGILAGGIAHNFNNALTGVLGFISLAAMHIDPSHKSYPLLQHAEKATKKAAGMAKQLLTFARGGAPVKKAVVLRKLVDDTLKFVPDSSGIQVKFRIADSLHAVLGDEEQLRQAFGNIVLNAVQAMPGGGTITISADNVRPAFDSLTSDQQTDYVCLTFSDQGCGIAETDLKRIFDPYFTTNPSKTGLGLASVHSIISRHGGQISVESKPGQGSIFTLLLPAAMAAMPDNSPTPSAEP